MEQVAEDALIVAIRCFSHADLGMVNGGRESSEDFSMRTDERMQAAVRADSQHGEDMSPVGGLDYLSRHIDSKVGEEPYASLPVPALLAVEKPASRLLLLAAPGLDELARGFAGLLTSAYGESLTVEVESPVFGLINFKTATQKWLEQLRT